MRKSMWLGHTCVSIYGHKYEISLKIVIHGDGKSSKTNDLERYSAVMFCAFCPQPRLLSSYGLPFFCFHLLLLYLWWSPKSRQLKTKFKIKLSHTGKFLFVSN